MEFIMWSGCSQFCHATWLLYSKIIFICFSPHISNRHTQYLPFTLESLEFINTLQVMTSQWHVYVKLLIQTSRDLKFLVEISKTISRIEYILYYSPEVSFQWCQRVTTVLPWANFSVSFHITKPSHSTLPSSPPPQYCKGNKCSINLGSLLKQNLPIDPCGGFVKVHFILQHLNPTPGQPSQAILGHWLPHSSQ